MTLKSLLLGSAAALAAVTGARAADAPVTMVEPEPVEYVRVCDAYGTGFFYIPGTETCLKIGGYVRMRVQSGSDEFSVRSLTYDTNGNGIIGDTILVGGVPVIDQIVTDSQDYTVGTRVRGRLEFDAREETELGLLRGKIRLQATNNILANNSPIDALPGDGSIAMTEGYIQLGGFTMGYLDSMWTAADGKIEDGLLLDEYDFAAGDFAQNRISYGYTSGGFYAGVSVEDDGDGDYTPDVIGKLAYNGKWGGAYLLGVYDEDSADAFDFRRGTLPSGVRAIYGFGTGEFNDGSGEDGAFALKGGVILKDLLAAKSTLKFEGVYAFDPTIYSRVSDLGRWAVRSANDFNQATFTSINGGYFDLSSQWQMGAAYRQDIDKLFLIANAVYGKTFDINATATVPGVAGSTVFRDLDAAEYWSVGGDIGYKLTKNFTVKGEVSYIDLDLPAGIDDFDQTRGFIEFRRDF